MERCDKKKPNKRDFVRFFFISTYPEAGSCYLVGKHQNKLHLHPILWYSHPTIHLAVRDSVASWD